VAGTSICIALAGAAVAGLLFLVSPPAPKPITAVAPIPTSPIPDPIIQGERAAAAQTGDTGNTTTPKTPPDAGPKSAAESPQRGLPSSILTAPVISEQTPGKEMPETAVKTGATPAPLSAPPIQQNGLAKEALADLVARGDARLAAGDLTSARLFYEGAAKSGDAQAALRLGQTYDPSFLAFTRFSGPRGIPATAAYWYLRADELGAAEAQGLLQALAKDVGLSAPLQPNR
jgi:hypothetical protein